jgi:NADPH-dependent 2,4-dienoyl-CoA reductase/sulfur reductase-like enzyme
MPNLDPEIARILERHAVSHNVGLKLGSGITGFERANNRLVSLLENGEKISLDMAIMAIEAITHTKNKKTKKSKKLLQLFCFCVTFLKKSVT